MLLRSLMTRSVFGLTARTSTLLALLSRIPSRFPFHNPTLEQYQQKHQFLTFYPENDARKRKTLHEDIDKILVPARISLRMFSLLVAKHLFEHLSPVISMSIWMRCLASVSPLLCDNWILRVGIDEGLDLGVGTNRPWSRVSTVGLNLVMTVTFSPCLSHSSSLSLQSPKR
jgi:hypothetical protein